MKEGTYTPTHKVAKTPTVGRPPKDKKANATHGKGVIFQPRFVRSDAPAIAAMMECKTPGELREKFGIILPDDLPWYRGDSVKTFSLLEALARRGFENLKERSIRFEDDSN